MKNLKKKIFEITALTVLTLFMSSSVIAQVQETQQDTTKQDTTQSSDQQQAQPQEQNQRTSQGVDSQEPDKGVNYRESVDKNELPQEVNSSLDELYPAHEITEVFKGEDDSYKVKVKNEDDEAIVYYDSEGSFLRAHNLSGLQQEGALPQNQSQRTQESQDQWGTDDRPNQQGTQGTQRGTQQENQQDTWGTDTDAKGTQQEPKGTWGKDKDDRQKGTQQETQDTWGTGTDDRQGAMNQDTENTQGSTYSQDQNQRTDKESQSNDPDKNVNYSERIEENELPQEVTSSLGELYPAHEIEEINRGDDDSYKVTVKNEDDEAAVYYNSEGKFLRARNLNEMQGAFPQEQSQRTRDSQDQDQWNTNDKEDDEHMKNESSAYPQEQNQSSQDVEESQDADRWGTKNRMPDAEGSQDANQRTWESEIDTTDTGTQNEWEEQGDTLKNEGSAYPQEQNQRTKEQTTWGTQGERSTGRSWGNEDTTQTEGQYKTAPVDTVASPQEQFQRATDDVDYSEEIQESELPESITSSLEELYPDHEIEEVYRGDDNTYKVKIKNDDDNVAVYFDSEGQFNRYENMKDQMKGKMNDMHNDMHKDDNKDTNKDW